MIDKERLELIKRNSQEIINEDKIKNLLKLKRKPIVYCGYETSGEVHLGHLVTITKLIDLEKAGFHVKVLFADWHTWLNRKGDWDFIHEQVKVWKKAFKAAGLKNAEFVLGSSFQRKIEYIDDILLMSLQTTINRALRSMQVVARDIEHARVSQIIYPFMQIADIKHLKVDLVEAGMDQRKIHVMGGELFKYIKYETPVFVHTELIPSLKGPGSKMSSSDKDSFISIRDSEEDVKRKINKAHCVAGVKEDNSVLSILKLIIFPRLKEFKIERDDKFGGNILFKDYVEVEKSFVKKELHPLDLKKAVANELIDILMPIKKHFSK